MTDPILEHRETPQTSEMGGEVEQSIHLPGPTYWPLFTSVGLAFLFVGLLITPVLAAFGLLVTIIGAVGWTWPERGEMRHG